MALAFLSECGLEATASSAKAQTKAFAGFKLNVNEVFRLPRGIFADEPSALPVMKPLIDTFDRQFFAVHLRSHVLIKLTSNEKLFWKPRELNRSLMMFSCGEYILRSAGAVEQTFGGITTRLWDDPFEWTLPEKLATSDLILEYLAEVEETRKRGFALFNSDEDLQREMPAPEKLKSIFTILLKTVSRAEHFQGRAFAVFQMFSDEKLPPL